MAQQLIRRFVEDVATAIELPDPVVEFGSLQVEAGQDGDLRPLFKDRPFTGTDMRQGPGVDRVEDLTKLTFEDDTVGTALCLDTLEHCDDPPAACRELARVASPDNGVAIVSSVMLFGIHGYPNDYFRFTPEGFRAMLKGFDETWVKGIGDPDLPMQVVAVARNGGGTPLDLDTLPSLAEAQRFWDESPRRIKLGPLRYPPQQLIRALVKQLPRVLRDARRR